MNYVNGQFCYFRQNFASKNPSDESIIDYFPQSTKEEVEYTVHCARTAFLEWRKLSRIQRAEYIDRLCDLLKTRQESLAVCISTETGKTLNESRAEVVESLHMAQYTFGMARMPNGDVVPSELAERDSYVIRKPKGVVAIISPWNFPAAISGFWCGLPALLEGNTVVFKPSEDAPQVGLEVVRLFHDAGFPPGVVNLLQGDGEVGNNLIEDDIDHICFTGSVDVGKHIRAVCAKSDHKTCSCEMGAKSAVIIFDDGNFDLGVSAALNSAFKLSGQRCVSSGRILIQRGTYDKFCKKFTKCAKMLKVGPWTEEDSFIGPLINQKQFDRVNEFNEMVNKDKDCKVLLKGKRVGTKGYFLSPHVYQCEWADKPFLKNEVFGPHVALIPFNDMDDAIRIFNDTDYGLSVGVITNDFIKMRQCKFELDAGMIYFNLGSIGAESHLPFSGVKKSGYGGGSAAETFNVVVNKISVTVNHSDKLNFPQGLK